jgi:TubC N-terminal docking domain
MTANELLRDLTMRGVALSVDGDQLNVDASEDLLTDELLATLKERKAELIPLLEAEPAPEPEAEEFTLTPPTAPAVARLGSPARPVVIRGTRMPADCPWHTCNGSMDSRGYTSGKCTLGYCRNCDTWFELLPPQDLGVYVGDLADDPLVEVDLHDRKPPRYVRQSVLSNWPPPLFNDRRKNHA